jgi:predicted TIM-barrel fold metal-dependent hydrolase
MWDKYPGMWRGLGEVMCRHDDLTTLLQDNETPVINHVAMRPLFEFCIEKDIACMVHHNADRTAERERDNHYEYLWEVQQVLEEFPSLKLVWCHAGASRRTFEETHHRMLDDLMSSFPNLTADISWCVWEDVICEGTGMPKKGWCQLFEAHPTRFTMGSDQVGQFINPAGGNLLKPEIVKYWKLYDCVSKETADAILYGNAYKLWFEGWKMPSGDGSDPRCVQIPPSMKCETLWSNTGKFVHNDERY